ncbi:MAG: hypothetical protein AAGB29_06295 [Planctomycetota bacterium]
MSNALNWLRNNPVTIVSAVIALLALGIFGYAYTLNSGLRERMQDQRQAMNALDGLRNGSVPFPNEDPTQPEITVRGITINQGVIDEFEVIYSRFDAQFENLYQYALQRNQADKEPMLDGLFPRPANAGRPFDARLAYRNRLMAMLDPPKAGDDILPVGLNAGGTPDPLFVSDQVADAQKVTEDSIYSTRFEASQSGFTENEFQDIFEAQQTRLVDVLKGTADSISVYAITDPLDPNFPFEIMPWAAPSAQDSPDLPDMWEAQVQLWVMEDIVRAIAAANAQAEEETGAVGVPASVVKRLTSLTVEPGYVGLDSGGLAGGTDIPELAAERIPSANRPQPDNFVVSPTGRVTNGVYLVRFATLQADIAFSKLPLLLDAIDSINFMAIVDVDIQDVDEYEVMQDLYFYGSDDVVEATITIEAILFRDWLAPMMPADVREMLAQPEPADDNNRRARNRGQR